eukprot:CAMPEP_0179423900 /NCGR_PEP_ID=MMETSP0799-20121207/11276_1 /TAXON_ID=46947 /ORGANISM="Geminigera cryophila, Strain CCMP2564" /LENGTH=61 /DNA_ID=CAMNT_0021198265 /DNA_START=202 /DNA_END=387 /DNA_ORIENTATION=+
MATPCCQVRSSHTVNGEKSRVRAISHKQVCKLDVPIGGCKMQSAPTCGLVECSVYLQHATF